MEIYYKINSPHIVHEHLDGEVVVLNMEKGHYFNLEKTASFIWQLIDSHKSNDLILKELLKAYDGDAEEIMTDLKKFFNFLEENDLISRFIPPENFKPQPIISQMSKVAYEKPLVEKYTDMEDLLLIDPIHEVDDNGWPHRTDESKITEPN
jgi:hypothetical protein